LFFPLSASMFYFRSRRRTTSSPCTWATFPKAC
jgi:hypothetical protein